MAPMYSVKSDLVPFRFSTPYNPYIDYAGMYHYTRPILNTSYLYRKHNELPYKYTDDQEEYTNVLYDINNSAHELHERSNDFSFDEFDLYFRLPKSIFPPARKVKADPNPIIDLFCNVNFELLEKSWLLDLEFGNRMNTGQAAIYDIRHKTIICKRSYVIHPDFANCDEEFKKTLMSYYDTVANEWILGYWRTTKNTSLKSFQKWIQVALEKYGMCWP